MVCTLSGAGRSKTEQRPSPAQDEKLRPMIPSPLSPLWLVQKEHGGCGEPTTQERARREGATRQTSHTAQGTIEWASASPTGA